MATKPIILVIGASGNVGIATLKALVSKYGERFDIRAGVRDPSKDEKFQELKGINLLFPRSFNSSYSSFNLFRIRSFISLFIHSITVVFVCSLSCPFFVPSFVYSFNCLFIPLFFHSIIHMIHS